LDITGNIDTDTAKGIIDLLCEAAQMGKCVIIVTHSADVVDRADYIFKLSDGRLNA